MHHVITCFTFDDVFLLGESRLAGGLKGGYSTENTGYDVSVYVCGFCTVFLMRDPCIVWNSIVCRAVCGHFVRFCIFVLMRHVIVCLHLVTCSARGRFTGGALELQYFRFLG